VLIGPAHAAIIACVAISGCKGKTAQVGPERPGEILAITTPLNAATTLLGWRDRDTLAPREGVVDLGEYHDAWAFSPDGDTLAVGTFRRTGVRLVDPKVPRILRDVPTPIAVVAVGWIGPDRVAALLQTGGVVIIDRRAGRVERQWHLSYRRPCGQRRQTTTPHGVVFLVAGRTGAAQLIRVDPAGTIRIVELPRVRAPSGAHTCGSVAFAVDPKRQRAILMAGRGPIAEVALNSLTVTYRTRPSALSPSHACRRAPGVCISQRTAVWLSGNTVAVSGADWINRRRGRAIRLPAGTAVLDTSTWSVRWIDRTASGVTITRRGTILTYGGVRAGLRATTLDGRRAWSAVRGREVREVAVAGNRTYILDNPPRTTRVLDTNNGGLISSQSKPFGRLDVLTGRAESGPL